MSSDNQLLVLFNACDIDGSGYIGKDEVREICAKFSIPTTDADSIFEDLDRDGDGKISFQDFEAGFDEYSNGSLPLTEIPTSPKINVEMFNGNRRNFESSQKGTIDKKRHNMSVESNFSRLDLIKLFHFFK